MNHSEIVSFLWGVANLIRDTFKRGVKPHVPDAWIDTSKRDPKDIVRMLAEVTGTRSK